LYLDTYRLRKEEVKQTLGKSKPVILIKADNLILLHQGKRTDVCYIPEKYHVLKDIAHISCLIHTISMIKSADEIRKKALSLVVRTQSSLTPDLAKQQPLLEKYRKLLESGEPPKDLKRELEDLISEAAKCRLLGLHHHVQRIKGEIAPNLWKNLSVVVMGPAMPRKGELSMQYMHKALQGSKKQECPYHKPSSHESSAVEGHRLIYAESIHEESQALDLLTSHICDESLGEGLLGDKEVMQGDFLRTVTPHHLSHLDFEGK